MAILGKKCKIWNVFKAFYEIAQYIREIIIYALFYGRLESWKLFEKNALIQDLL